MPKTILCVDDEANLLKLYEQVLQSEGYLVVASSNGRDALQRLNARPIDLVVLDIRIGREDGLELLKQIKRDHPDVPVILNSAYSSYKSDFQTWLASDYLVKSPDLGELKEQIRRLLEFDARPV